MLRSFFRVSSRHLSTSGHVASKMNPSNDLYPKKAYIKNLPEEKRVEIKFKLEDKDLGFARWFSFNRSVEDTVQQVKERIVANVDKATLKHRKRKKKTSPGEMATGADESSLVDVQQNDLSVEPGVPFRAVLLMENTTLVINRCVFQFDIDPPSIKTLKLPSCIMAGFPVYPSKLEVENCDTAQCEFVWYKSPLSLKRAPEADSGEWVLVARGTPYLATNSEIGVWLKLECIPKTGTRQGLTEAAVTSQVVGAGPGPVPFETRHNFTKHFMDASGFRVVTYNILADLYADSDYTRTVLHPYCPPYALAIDYRKQLILKELIGYKADIMCLQEVDNKVFDGDLLPVFTSLACDAVFSKKGGQVSEGMACIFNTNKFRLVDATTIVLADELPTNPILIDLFEAVNMNENLSKRILARTTACQLVVLESLHNARRIVVANTHLYFHPDADHIRLLQAAIVLRLAHALHKRESDQGKDVSLVFCGDFNSCPGYGVLELMALQHIDQHFDAWSSNPSEAVKDLSLYNPIAMETACGTPPFTNYSAEFQGCLDYIFIEKAKLTVEQVVPLPSQEEVTQHTALPSILFPSDHIALVVDLKWL